MFALIGAVCTLAASASAQVLFQTSFESPEHGAGTSVAGVNGWNNGINGGATHEIRTGVAHGGSQSLTFDNTTTFDNWYSVRRALPTYTASPANPLSIRVRLWLSAATQANRVYGLYSGGTPTSHMGGTIAGITIGGDGNVRTGSNWIATYRDIDWTAAPGTYLERWLTLGLDYNGTQFTTWIEGFADGSRYSQTFNRMAPLSMNLGSDMVEGTTAASGQAFFDDLVVESVPEPITLSLLAVGLAALTRRRRA
jgi:hypothetical protein